MTDIRDLIKTTAAHTRDLIGNEVIFPALSTSDEVAVRVRGLVNRYAIAPFTDRRWLNHFLSAPPLKVFQIDSVKTISYIRPATGEQALKYLHGLPRVRLVYFGGDPQLGFLANPGDARFASLGTSPIVIQYLIDVAALRPPMAAFEPFSLIEAGFDGKNFWAYRIVPDPTYYRLAFDMQGAFAERQTVNLIRAKRGAMPGHLVAYQEAIEAVQKAEREAREQELERRRQDLTYRLQDALQYAGAEYVRHIEDNEDHVRVSYNVGGRIYHSVVRKDMSVVAAGFCTAGHDDWHDLTTLVDLIEYGQRTGHYAVRRGNYYEDY